MKRTVRSAKSSNGCQRCKRKRIKCDEAKPECNGCVSAGETCPGYAKQLRWSTKHELLSKPAKETTPGPSTKSNDHVGIEGVYSTREQGSNHGLQEQSPSASSPEDVADGVPTEDNTMDADIGPSPPLPEWMQINMSRFDEAAFRDAVVNGQDVLHNQPMQLPDFDMAAASLPWTFPLDFNGQASWYNSNDLPMHRTNNTLVDSERKHQINSQRNNNSSNPSALTGSSSLLHTFYRLSLPRSVPGFADDDFVNYYFKHVSRLFSCFDSSSNPFRTMVAGCWTTNRTINLTIQSMAIAHLSNWYPYMAPLGLSKRAQAWQSLQKDLKRTGSGACHSSDHEMLSLLLLGLSSSWHVSSNLGSQFLFIARNLIQYRLQHNSAETSSAQTFFEEALIYWEMLTSFVDPVPLTPFVGHGCPDIQSFPSTGPRLPHPWTGIITELHFALAEVGRVMRRHRSASATMYNTDVGESQWAARLDSFLTSIEIPDEDAIMDYEDATTPKKDLIRCAEACRDVALLEICSVFPAILQTRVSSGSESEGLSSSVFFDQDMTPTQKVEAWPLIVGIHIVELLQLVPLTSAACRLQPVLLLSAASQLRFSSSAQSPESSEMDSGDHIVEHRYFVEARMLALSRKFPQKPFSRMIDIIKEVWQRLDSGDTGAHWMDVMNEKGWYTIMG